MIFIDNFTFRNAPINDVPILVDTIIEAENHILSISQIQNKLGFMFRFGNNLAPINANEKNNFRKVSDKISSHKDSLDYFPFTLKSL